MSNFIIIEENNNNSGFIHQRIFSSNLKKCNLNLFIIPTNQETDSTFIESD